MSKVAYDTATAGIFPQYPPTGPGPSGNNAPPCPPSYDEAIGHQPSVSTLPTPPLNQQQHHPSSEDFVKVVEDDLEMDQDMDEDQDYEESRPLKMGRIPNTRAQYTFIQPNDTIQAGKKKKSNNNNGSSACSTPEIGGSPLPSHPGYPQQQHPVSAYPYPSRHPQCAAPPHNLTQRPFIVPTGNNSMQHLYSVPGPSLNAPSAPPSAPDTAPPTSYAPPSMPPPPLEQFNDTKQIHAPVVNPPSEFASELGSPSSSIAAAPTTTYAPSPFPPPPQSLPVPEAPLAGVPSLPGLMNSQDISIAEFERTKKGVESCDPVLGDPYQLYRFFVAHNDRPTLHIAIKGNN